MLRKLNKGTDVEKHIPRFKTQVLFIVLVWVPLKAHFETKIF